MSNSGLSTEFVVGRVGSQLLPRFYEWEPLSTMGAVSIHPSAVIGQNAEWIGQDTQYPVQLGVNVIVRAFCTIDAGVKRHTRVGDDCLLMAHVHLGHDVQLGERVQVAPHASLGGCVTVGSDVKIGMGAVVKPHVTIGDNARIGMGAVVTKDIPPGETWVGNPARRLTK